MKQMSQRLLLLIIVLLCIVIGDGIPSKSIAVLVIGEHRIYDGTWPSHEKYLYQPIREHNRLDIFTCQKEGEIIPLRMPKPTAEFNVPKSSQKESWASCFEMLLNWLCLTQHEDKCDIESAVEIGHAILKARYDWVIRIRPDIEMVYDIPWPPKITGDVMSQIQKGNLINYPWSFDLTTNCFGGVAREEFIKHQGCPPSHYKNKCFDIGDQAALVSSKVASSYFGYPASKYLDFDSITMLEEFYSDDIKEVMRESCLFATAATYPMENVLNNRLRRENISIGPMEFPYFLPGPRKNVLDESCFSSIPPMNEEVERGGGSRRSFLMTCFEKESDQRHVLNQMNEVFNFRSLKFCTGDKLSISKEEEEEEEDRHIEVGDFSVGDMVEEEEDEEGNMVNRNVDDFEDMLETPELITDLTSSNSADQPIQKQDALFDSEKNVANQSRAVAVLVIGEHRIYDGTWPSHEKYLYQPIRKQNQLHVFTCQKEGELIPIHMPKPTAEFNVPKGYYQMDSWAACYEFMLLWLCKSQHEEECETNNSAVEIGHAILKARYDWVIRIRPDIEMVYDIPWPPKITGDVMSHLQNAIFNQYPWASLVTANSLTSRLREVFLEQKRCPKSTPGTTSRSKCVDIVDQVAVIKPSVSSIYFGYPASKYLDFKNVLASQKKYNATTLQYLKESCLYKQAKDRPPENWLNHRLRSERVSLGPIEFPYSLPGPRKSQVHCDPPLTILKASSLASCFADNGDKKHINEGIKRVRDARGLTYRCM